jgi:hypothetical protein
MVDRRKVVSTAAFGSERLDGAPQKSLRTVTDAIKLVVRQHPDQRSRLGAENIICIGQVGLQNAKTPKHPACAGVEGLLYETGPFSRTC